MFSGEKKEINDILPVKDGELTHAFNSLLSLVKMTVRVLFFVLEPKPLRTKKIGATKFWKLKTAEQVIIDLADSSKVKLKLPVGDLASYLVYTANHSPPAQNLVAAGASGS